MTWYEWYIVFALSGSLTSYMVLFRPARYIATQLNENSVCSTNPTLSGLVWIFLAFIATPLLITPILSNKKQTIFIHTLAKTFATGVKET